LPPSLVLLEFLEDQLIDERLIAAIADLKHSGYRLALDDFRYIPSAEPALALVDVVKLDLLALGHEQFAQAVERLKPYGVTLLAEKLETPEDYAHCAQAGCDLFQGYFFCRPELVRGRRVDANRLAVMEILAALQEPGVQLDGLERIIARNVGLSYRLLRYINSAFFGMRQHVRSLRQALALLGVENLKLWASLSVFASIDDKPAELTVTALIRARFCELAGQHLADTGRSELFTLGLFSVIDALMDTPIEDVLAKIPFPADMRDALITHTGDKGRLLECITAFEAGRFEDAAAIIPNAGELYLQSLAWANQAADPLFPQTVPAAA